MTRTHLLIPTLALGLAAGLTTIACDDDPEPRISVTGKVTDFTTSDPLPGVSVCVYNRPGLGCKTTDANGDVTLSVPPSTDMVLEVSADDYYSGLSYYTSDAEDEVFSGSLPMINRLEADLLMGLISEVPDDTKGHVAVVALDSLSTTGASFVPDVTFTLEAAAGGVRWYSDEDLSPDTSLTATTTAGGGGIMNATPGDWTLTATHATLTCEPYLARSAGQADTFEALVVAEHVTLIYLYCH